MQAPETNAPPEGIYDIIVPAPEPSWWSIIGVLFLTLGVFALLIGLILYLLRHRDGSGRGPGPGQRVARELDRIDRNRDQLPPNRFALAISDALKDYLAERFRDPVRFETTPEFLKRISRSETPLPPAAVQELRDFLVAAEEVKFGNIRDAAELAGPLLRNARQLVAICESVSEGRTPGRG